MLFARANVSMNDLGMISTARMQDYLLGGGDHFSFDRACVDDSPVIEWVRGVLLHDRTFLFSAMSFMLDRGIKQFLDLGSGIATMGGPLDVAEYLCREIRVVHVDNDIAVIEHGKLRARIGGQANAGFVHANVLDADLVLWTAIREGILDLREPVGVLAIGLLHLIGPQQAPELVVPRYCAAFAAGSSAAISHLTPGLALSHLDEVGRLLAGSNRCLHPRGELEIKQMFGELAIVEPGLMPLHHRVWTPGKSRGADIRPCAGLLAGVAIKV